MNKPETYLRNVGLTGFFLFLVACSQNELSTEKDKPNLVIILADDMGYGDPRCYNAASKIPTPYMDSLANQGVMFTDAHSPSAVCTPTRYGLLTGRYAWRSRLKKEVLWSGYDDPLIPQDRMTIASYLQQQGYQTGVVGKWHLGLHFLQEKGNRFVQPKTHHESGLMGARNVDFTSNVYDGPNALGFSYSFLSSAGHNLEPFCFVENEYVVGHPTEWRQAKTPIAPGLSGVGVHEGWMVPGWDDREVGPTLTEKAKLFLQDASRKDKPFFLYFAPVAPHRPCTPPEFIQGKSSAGVRGDMVAEFDWAVGQIMQVLEANGQADNTILIVTSDNGARLESDNGEDYGHKSNGDWRGAKGSLYEGGHRVPFVLRWPKQIQGGTINNNLVCLTDIFATVASFMGDSLPQNVAEDSYNVLPTIMENQVVRTAIVHHDFSGNFAIRKNHWKLITQGVKGAVELFDLRSDPDESDNVLDNHPQKVEALMALLNKYRREYKSVEPSR